MKKIFIHTLLLFFISINVYSQIVNGQFLIGGALEESSSATIQLSDGDYLFCGTTKSYGNGNQDLLLIRFNSDFSIDWQKTIGGSLDDFLNNMTQPVENSDGSIMVLGNTKSYGMGNVDVLLIKISATGNVIWSKVYGGINEERACVIRSTLDGGFIFSGSTDSYNTPTSTTIERDLFLVKLDWLGNVIWANTWGTTDNNDNYTSNYSTQISEIKQLPDSSYIIGGIMEGLGSSDANSFMARINPNGTINWFKKYTSSSSAGHEVINTIVLQNNTNAFANGLTKYGSIGISGRGLLFNFNINTGTVNWAKNYGNINSNYNWIFKNYKESSNRFVLSMYENGSGFGGYDISCFAIDSNGIILQQKVFGTPNFDMSVFCTPTIDNGYLFSGVSGTGVNKDSYLVKIDNFWNSGCNETNITITNSNITINPQNYNPTIVTSINSSSISLTSNPVNVNIDTLCIEVIPTCNLSSNFSSTSTCYGDTTYFTDLSIDSIGNIIDWNWNFGDESTLVGIQNPSHFYTNPGHFNVTLIVTNDNNCVDSITIPITVNPISTTTQNLSICQGDSVFFGGQFYNITGVYSDSLQSSFGCDSIHTLNLDVITSFQILQNQSICQGDSILLGGNYQFLAGIYTDSLQATSGCDSIVFTTLTINPTFTSNQSTSICQGDSILLGGSFQTTAGIYSDNYSSFNGCDSIVNTTLIIHPTEIINQNIEICQGDSIFLEGMFQTSAGIYTDMYNSVLGCDSNVITSLSIKSIGLATLNPITICDNDSALIFGVYQNIAGIYNQVIPNGAINGCDSIVYQELLVNSTYEIFANETICQGDSIFLGGAFQTSNGIYTDVYSSSSGCDSTITTTLIVFNNFLTNINETICQGDSIFIAGAYQFITGTFIESLISSTGCDSIVTTNLIVKLTPQIIAYSDTTIIIGSSVQLNASGGNSYFWSPDFQLNCVNCQNPIASPEITMDYVVTGYIDGCNASDTITIIVSKPPIFFYAPNSFTPNNDGINDIFYFYGEGIKEFEVQIFDRWGELLFESIDIDQGWNGIYKGKEVQMDVYVYKVKLKSFENEYFREIGSINIIR